MQPVSVQYIQYMDHNTIKVHEYKIRNLCANKLLYFFYINDKGFVFLLWIYPVLGFGKKIQRRFEVIGRPFGVLGVKRALLMKEYIVFWIEIIRRGSENYRLPLKDF